MRHTLLTIAVILNIINFISIAGFASWFAEDEMYCPRPLKEDEIIMNNPVGASSDRKISILRDSVEIPSLSTYVPGETLSIVLSNTADQFVIETSGGSFPDGGCNGKRIIESPARLELPANNEEDILIWAGWASGHSQVLISPHFILRGSGNGAKVVKKNETKDMHKKEKNRKEADTTSLRGAMKFLRRSIRSKSFLTFFVVLIVLTFCFCLYKFYVKFVVSKNFTKSV